MASTTVIESILYDEFKGEEAQPKRPILKDRMSPTDEFVKVSRYLSTIFAFNNIPLNLVGISFILAERMEFKTNIVYLLKGDKVEIGDMLGYARRYKKNGKEDTNSVDKLIKDCVKYDIIRPTETQGKYEVNSYLFSTGSTAETRKLQAHFDFDNDAFAVGAMQRSKITGETIRKAVANKKDKQIPGQLSLFDEDSQSAYQQPRQIAKKKAVTKKNKFNDIIQSDYSGISEEDLLDN